MASLQDILQEEQFSDCHPLSGCTFGVCLCSPCLRKAGLGNGAGMGCEAMTPSLRLPKGIAFLAPDFVKGGMVLGWVGGWLLLAQLTKASAAATRWACTMQIRCEPQPVCRHRLGAIVEQFPLGKVTSARNLTNVMAFTGLFCRGLHPSMEQTAISAMVRIGSNRTNRTADICQGETTSPFQIAATRCSSVPGGMLLELEPFEPFATSVDCFHRV